MHYFSFSSAFEALSGEFIRTLGEATSTMPSGLYNGRKLLLLAFDFSDGILKRYDNLLLFFFVKLVNSYVKWRYDRHLNTFVRMYDLI